MLLQNYIFYKFKFFTTQETVSSNGLLSRVQSFHLARLVCFSLAVLGVLGGITAVEADHHRQSGTPEYQQYWHQWRGPTADGMAIGSSNPPIEWSENQNIRWKVEIPGEGHATPIIWKDQIFVLTAVEVQPEEPESSENNIQESKAGKEEEKKSEDLFFGLPFDQLFETAQRQPRGRGQRNEAPKLTLKLTVLALKRADGQVQWERVVRETSPHEGTPHQTTTWASYSPTTDGEYLYANFGSFGLYCLDLDGNLQWELDLGDMRTRNSFGEGSSAALYEDTLVVNWDHEGDSFITALDKRNGQELWRMDRDERTSWATPFITDHTGSPQAIISATNRIRSYDLKSGNVLWEAGGMTANVIPSPVLDDESGIVYVMSGFRGNALLAIRLQDASGDITSSGSIVWDYGQDTPYVPSPLLYDNNLYFIKNRNGVISCLDAKTGKVHYGPERLEGIGDVYASPVGAGGRIYLPDRDGNIAVLNHGESLEMLTVNRLDDGFSASPAIVEDEIYLRGHNYLYCITNN